MSRSANAPSTGETGDESLPPRARMAVVLSHPTQYYSPWFRWLAAHGWDLRVFYLWDFGVSARHDPGFGREVRWDVDLLSGYEYEFVPNVDRDPGTHHFGGLNNPQLIPRLRAWQPDAVLLFGYKFRTHLRLILTRRWPLVFRGDSHLIDHPKPHGLKRWILSFVYSRFQAVTYVGQANRDYFRAFGVPESRLFFAPHAVDASRFAANDTVRHECAALRAELGIGDRAVVLFAGKFVAAKQPRQLLSAFLDVAPRDTALVFVGDGEERPALEAAARAHPEVAVRFLPFANQTEMPSRYLLADIVALPSAGLAETWGLTVNEAMHLGRPCLVSNRVGCQRDLVIDGVTGWVFRADSPEDLRATLRRAIGAVTSDRARFAAAVRERVAAYSYAAAAAGLQAAVAAACKTGQRS